MSQYEIPVVSEDSAANYPYVVETLNTSNWNTSAAMVTLEAAQEHAQGLHQQYPQLPVRIKHCCGGFVITHQLPHWKPCEKDEKPYAVALWSGRGEPPDIGSNVNIRINSIGAGTVTGYTVYKGYLGVMVKAEESSRPSWHRAQNPDNQPALVFGAELS